MTTWTSVSTAASTWTSVNRDYRDRWEDWEVFTWGALESSGVTWAAMAGDTFIGTSNPTTAWTSVL